MWTRITKRPLLILAAAVALGAVLAVACGGAEPTPAPTHAPAAALVAHKAGTTHSLQPKRLESVIEIAMYEMYFATPQGERNPTFRLPAGKTIGIHIHNEGTVMHEFVIGRNMKEGEYQQVLTKLVPADIFYYYGQTKSEVGDAEFGELEVEPGLRDIWVRIKIPAELKGEWELGCLAEGHYEAGMKAKLIIE